MDYFFQILEKIVYVILMLGVGVLAKKARMVSNEGEKDLSRLMLDLIWPALIFSSITGSLNARDILDNFWLPILAITIHLTGWALGAFFARLLGYAGDRRKIFVFHATMNNFVVMALPFAQLFLPEKGAALLSVANLGSTVMLWSLGATVVAGSLGVKQTAKNICSVGMITTVVSVALVLLGLNRFIPPLVADLTRTLGQPTLFIGLFIAGTQVYKLGAKALKFDVWNLMVGFLRLVAVPALMFVLAIFFKPFISREALIIFMIVAITPSSVNSVTMALRYGSSAELAAEGVLFTHLASAITMVGFILLMNRYLLA